MAGVSVLTVLAVLGFVSTQSFSFAMILPYSLSAVPTGRDVKEDRYRSAPVGRHS